MSQNKHPSQLGLAGLINTHPMQGQLNTLLAGQSPMPQSQGILSTALQIAEPQPQPALLAGLLGLQIPTPMPASLKWRYVEDRFSRFQENLQLTSLQAADGVTKFKGVVSTLNAAYYGHNSETANAFVIGSWAKNTMIRPPRDVDLYFVLPIEVYHRFQSYAPGTNRQSALLQEVKAKLLGSYSTSDIKGDGPVVLAGFSTFNVEVVPAFNYEMNERSFYVCDTKNGGSYMLTKPLHEVDALNAAEGRCNNNVRPLIRMLKAWQTNCSVQIQSFSLELLAAAFLDQWSFKGNGLFYYDWLVRDFFAYMIARANSYLFAPGTFNLLWLGDAWKTRAESAYSRACKACEFEQASNMEAAGDEWQKIFGNDIPKKI